MPQLQPNQMPTAQQSNTNYPPTQDIMQQQQGGQKPSNIPGVNMALDPVEHAMRIIGTAIKGRQEQGAPGAQEQTQGHLAPVFP